MAARIVYEKRHEELFDKASGLLFHLSRGLLKVKDSVVIALPGGRSVQGLLAALLQNRDELDDSSWKHLHFFLVDERLVGPEDRDSNFKLLNDCFFTKACQEGLIEECQIHPFVFKPTIPDLGTRAYQRELEHYGGCFDVVVLGVGEDSHIASLFPFHPALTFAQPFFLTLTDSPKPPPARMSASVSLIKSSKLALLLFIGAAKQKALKDYVDESVGEKQCPAKIANSIEKVYVVTDQPTAFTPT